MSLPNPALPTARTDAPPAAGHSHCVGGADEANLVMHHSGGSAENTTDRQAK